MTYDVIVGGKTYKFNTQKEQEDFINQGYGNHTRMNLGNSITLISKPDNKPLLDPNKTYNVQLPEVEVTNGQTKIQNTGHNDPIISQIFQGNYFGKKFVPTEQNINHYLNLYKGDKQNNEKFAPKEWMKIGGMHLLAGAAIPTIATAPIATAIGAAGGYASDWLWRNYTGKSFGDNVLDWTGLQNYSNPYIDSDMIRDAADALEPLAFFTGGLGVEDIAEKYIANKLIPRTKNNLAGAVMMANTTDNVMAPSEDLMSWPVHTIKQYPNIQTTRNADTKLPTNFEFEINGIPMYSPKQYDLMRYITHNQEQYPKHTLYGEDQYEVDQYYPNMYFIERPYEKGSMFDYSKLNPDRKKFNINNYHEDSFGVFEPIEKLPEDAIFLYISPNGKSAYWTKDGILYRDSDHWGDGIKSSSWHLKGAECPGGHCGNFGLGNFYLGKISFDDLYKNQFLTDPNRYGYGEWPTNIYTEEVNLSRFAKEKPLRITQLEKDLFKKFNDAKQSGDIEKINNLIDWVRHKQHGTSGEERLLYFDFERNLYDLQDDVIDGNNIFIETVGEDNIILPKRKRIRRNQ